MERIESPVYRRLGKSGLVVPSVGIGCNNLGRPGTPTRTQEGTNEVIAAAVTPASASSTSPTSTAPNPASQKPCSAPPSPSSASTATN